MKQRSSCRTTEPKATFLACVRSSYLKQSYEGKPSNKKGIKKIKLSSRGSKKALREAFKKFYKEQKSKDREIGLEINRLFAEFFYETKYIQKSGKPADEETIKFLGSLAKQIKDLKETGRFKHDFPSFASFRRYIKKEGVTLKEITEISEQ